MIGGVTRFVPVLLASACSFTPGQLAVQEIDAAIEQSDAPVDVAIDAVPDARAFDPALDCPTSYDVTIGESTTRYRIITTEANFATQYAACNADLADATHLASPETQTELVAIRTHLGGTFAPSRKYYLGIVQPPNQAAVDVGWLVYSGGPVPPNQWENGEPEDAGGGENNAQNVSSLWVDSGLTDSGGALAYGALCECDGIPIAPAALAAIP